MFAQDTAGVGGITAVLRPASPGARVCFEGTDRCVGADANGVFRFSGVRPGVQKLSVRLAGVNNPLAAGQVEVRAGLDSSVEIALPDVGSVRESVTVSESVYVAPEEIKNSVYLTPAREIQQSAGALQDVSRYVQVLPGVAIGSDDFRNDIIVRGGSPLENLFIVDNIEVPNINTFANFASAGGTVGILDAGLIQDVTFLTGGYPAPFVNRASSVLQMALREGSRDQFEGRATLGFAGAGAILGGPIRQGRGSWVISARRSFLDLFTKDLGFGGVPKTYTFNGKALYDLTPRDRIWAVSIAGVDSIRLGATAGGKNDKEVDSFDIRYSGWRSATGFNWQRLFSDRAVGLLGVAYSSSSTDDSIKDLVRNGIPAAGADINALIASSPTVFSEKSREGEATVKYDLTVDTVNMGKLQAGGSFKTFDIHYLTASPYGVDSPYSLTRNLNPFQLSQNFNAQQSGAYFQATRNIGSRLNLTFGGRVDRYSYINATRLSPRAGLSYRLAPRLSWRASFGSYYQQPNFLFLAAFPQNRGAVPFRADHYVTGLAWSLTDSTRISVEAYRKNYKDYPVSTQFPALSLANLGDTFNIRDILFPLASAGRGRAQGVEFLVDRRFGTKWYGQANLSFSSARQAGLDRVLRPASFDYPRIFNLTGGYHPNARWEFTTRFSYLAGRPYTPLDLVASAKQDRAIFDLRQVNASRFPDYIRLDLRADRVFTVRGKPLRVFVGVQNAFDRQNIALYTWNRLTNALQVNKQLGAFPNIGLDWRF